MVGYECGAKPVFVAGEDGVIHLHPDCVTQDRLGESRKDFSLRSENPRLLPGVQVRGYCKVEERYRRFPEWNAHCCDMCSLVVASSVSIMIDEVAVVFDLLSYPSGSP